MKSRNNLFHCVAPIINVAGWASSTSTVMIEVEHKEAGEYNNTGIVTTGQCALFNLTGANLMPGRPTPFDITRAIFQSSHSTTTRGNGKVAYGHS